MLKTELENSEKKNNEFLEVPYCKINVTKIKQFFDFFLKIYKK